MTDSKTLEVSFQGSDDDRNLYTVIHNPELLSMGLHRQIMRYGLIGPSARHPEVHGTLKGSRHAFMEMILTYGLTVQVVPYRETSFDNVR
ncbi:MAG TPA: hypothetical protein VFY10_01670 [Dehalococcoidia bacterium]|nr:hypothetical protein [Dehalococcoidia bacterium]